MHYFAGSSGLLQVDPSPTHEQRSLDLHQAAQGSLAARMDHDDVRIASPLLRAHGRIKP